jgi:hypothetical protein
MGNPSWLSSQDRVRPCEEVHEEIPFCLERLGRGGFTAERDVTGIFLERGMADQQASENRQTCPSTSYQPK